MNITIEYVSTGKGYAPPEPTGTPWPCPLVSPDPVYAADGTVTCTVQTTELPPTGAPDVAGIYLGGLGLLLLGAVVISAVTAHRRNR